MLQQNKQFITPCKNPELKDPLEAREIFAVSLRTQKRKEIINAKRLKLTKSKAQVSALLTTVES